MMAKKYKWCLHCERVYEDGKYRLINGLKYCPYDDCDGDTFLDGWDWEKIRSVNDYPVRPEKNIVYPLYGFYYWGGN
jgi:hypothetical protein